MEKKNSRVTIIIAILSILVCTFGGYFIYNEFIDKKESVNISTDNGNQNQVYDKNNTDLNSNNQNQSNDNNSTMYDYYSIAGMYGDKKSNINYNLYLNENGTFSYVVAGEGSPSINIGSYIIKNNTIKLNYWMYLASQYNDYSEITSITNKTASVIINADKTLTLSKQPGNINNVSVNMKKITGTEEQDLLKTKYFDIVYLIKNLISDFSE